MSSSRAWSAVVVSLAAWATRRFACWNQAEPLASHLLLPSSPDPCLRWPCTPQLCSAAAALACDPGIRYQCVQSDPHKLHHKSLLYRKQ